MNKTISEVLLALGKDQMDVLFAHYECVSMDDSVFFPLLETVLTTFETHGLTNAEIDIIWEYAYCIYDRLCKRAEPESTFEENRDLLLSYLHGSIKLRKRKRGVKDQ